MPLAAILIGIVMEDMIYSRKAYGKEEGKKVIKWNLMAIFIIGTLILIFSFEPAYNSLGKLAGSTMFHVSNRQIALPLYNRLFLKFGIAGGTALILGTILSVLLYFKKRQELACMAIFSSVALVVVLAFSLISSVPGDHDSSQARFAIELKNTIPHKDSVFVYGKISGVFVHYFGRPIKTVSETEIEGLYNDDHWLVVSGENVDEIRKEYCFREVKTCYIHDHNRLTPLVIVHRRNLSVTCRTKRESQI